MKSTMGLMIIMHYYYEYEKYIVLMIYYYYEYEQYTRINNQ